MDHYESEEYGGYGVGYGSGYGEVDIYGGGEADREGKLWGGMATLVYMLLLISTIFIPYVFTPPEPVRELGVLVDFGIGDTGWGDEDLAPAIIGRAARAAAQTAAERGGDVFTADDPESEAVVRQADPNARPSDRDVVETEPAREVNRRALFPGMTEGSTATSQGEAGGEGNQGVPGGSPGGVQGAGGGTGSSGFSLAGRSLVGSLPRPAYDSNDEGRVVIRITVDRSGRVINAIYEQAGSTTNTRALVDAARAAALKARFSDSDSDIQTGTITYIFLLKPKD